MTMYPAAIPVVLFAYNRPKHVRLTLSCLKKNNVSLIYAFSDGPRSDTDRPLVEEVRSVLRAVDWCELTLFERTENLGLGRSILTGVAEIFQRHEAVIVFEDDLVCVPGTYNYLCSALRHYRDDQRVMSVTGWTHPRVTPSGVQDKPYFDGRAESLVWGAWARSWSGMKQDAWRLLQQCHQQGIDVFRYGADLPATAKQELQQNVWAVRFIYWHLLQRGLCMRPPWSMVEHIGYGADATNTKKEEWFTNPPLRTAPVPPDTWPQSVEDPECPRLWQRIYGYPPSAGRAGGAASAAKPTPAAERANSNQPKTDGEFDCRTAPRSRVFGIDRGLPIDRYYIEKFLHANRDLIHGHVLEIGDSGYTKKFGRDLDRVDVLSVVEDPQATIVGDLATGEAIPRGAFDCIILVQTLQMIFDVKAAVRHAIDALKPGGALLVTGSGISQISRYDMDRWGEYWRFTDRALKSLLSEVLPGDRVHVEAHGNLAVAKAFLEGLSMQEIPAAALDMNDPDYQVLVTAKAIKSTAADSCPDEARRLVSPSRTALPPTILLYHRVCEDACDAHLLSVSPLNFERHLHHLRSRFRVLPLGDLLDDIRRGRLPGNTVAITFDDGYADNLTHALPILEAAGLPATVFVTSGMVGVQRAFWWDEVEQILLRQDRLPGELRFDGLTNERLHFDLRSRPARLQAHDRLCALLRDLPPRDIEAAMTQLRQWAPMHADEPVAHPVLGAGQLRMLSDSPLIDIGAHSVTHARLSTLPPNEQLEEIAASRKQIEGLTGTAVRFFSYPFGSTADFTAETARLVAREGYMAGIANIQGSLSLPAAFFALPRKLVRNWTADQFMAWLAEPNASGRFESLAVKERRERLGSEPVGAGRCLPSAAPATVALNAADYPIHRRSR
jgi:peptidoglycan/xylan/chitin deacetylase (PgdA/CDA1 family)